MSRMPANASGNPVSALRRPVPRSVDEVAADLETLLTKIIAAYEPLAALATEHRAALARADRDAIEACNERQRQAAMRLAELDAHRASVVRSAAVALKNVNVGTSTGAEPSVREIAAACPEPRRSRLLELGRQAREAAQRGTSAQAALKSAAGTLVAHMNGLIAHVARSLSPTGTYTRSLAVPAGAAPLVGALDIVS